MNNQTDNSTLIDNTKALIPLTKTTPFKHQAEIIEATKDQRYWGYFMEQGTGKTHVTIAVMTHLYRTGKINGVIILAPNGVHDNWVRNEIPIHCGLRHPEDMIIGLWHGADGERKRRTWGWIANSAEPVLVVLAANIEAVRTEIFLKSIRKFVATRRYLLVIDESTTIKNPKTEQSKAVHKFLSKNAAYSRILTGTPITQSPLDLWSQCRALDEQALPFPSYTSFRHQFAIEQILTFGHRSFNKVVGYQNQNYLAELLAKFTTRILKKDCLDLPEKVYQTRYVELTPEQKRIYKDLVKQCLSNVGGEIVTVTEVITMMLRLQQVTLGYVQTDDGTLRNIEHNRIDRLKNLLEENTSKAIIFCRFLEDVNQVSKAIHECGYTQVIYSGNISPAGRELAIDQFQNHDAQYFIATSAASKGLTLTAAEQVIYYSQGFSLETRLQSEDRAHRIGQKKTVLYTDLVAQGTVDDRIVDALKNKKELANSVLDKARLLELLNMDLE